MLKGMLIASLSFVAVSKILFEGNFVQRQCLQKFRNEQVRIFRIFGINGSTDVGGHWPALTEHSFSPHFSSSNFKNLFARWSRRPEVQNESHWVKVLSGLVLSGDSRRESISLSFSAFQGNLKSLALGSFLISLHPPATMTHLGHFVRGTGRQFSIS